MNPQILNLADKVLKQYLSYSENDLRQMLMEESHTFWDDFLTINLTQFYDCDITKTILVNDIKTGTLLTNTEFFELHNLVIEFPVKNASNDDFYNYFEVAA